MAILPIKISGEPVLHTKATEVTVFDADLAQLIKDMIDTMHAAPGVGLAAPQIGIGKRIFVYEWVDENDQLHSGTAINPTLLMQPLKIDPLNEDEEAEGCLSFPGERFPLRRSDHVRLKAFDVDGTPFEQEATGWLARIFQHEYDHLDGVLYINRLEPEYQKTVRKLEHKNGWGVPGQSWMPGVDIEEP